MGAARWVGSVAVALALVASGCSSDTSDRPEGAGPGTTSTSVPPAAAVFEEDPTFVEGECWWELAPELAADTEVTCGTVDVPADRTDADSDLLTLAVARFHRQGAEAEAPPLVFLHGGPGGDSLVAAPALEDVAGSLAERDLVLYDQRGTGRSTPSLDCPEKEQAVLDALASVDGWDAELAANEAAALACRDRLVGDGIDLDDYDTPASVEDLETIRQAFGADTWNVYGRSYGTRLGLAYARAHPDAVRSLLIDSVYAPNVVDVERNLGLPTEAFAALTEACDAQPACVAANGHVDEELAKAVASFDADPETVTGTVTVGGEEQTLSFTLDGADLRGGMFAAQYRIGLLPLLPSLIHALAGGDRSIVPQFISTGVPGLIDPSEGAFLSFECADSGRLLGEGGFEAMRQDPGDDDLYALGTAEPFCAVWDVPAVPEAFNEPVVVDVPTLVFGGTLDPITPFAESEAQAERLPDARFVAVPGGGHGDVNVDDCTRSAATAFWADPAADLPACVAALRPAPFS